MPMLFPSGLLYALMIGGLMALRRRRRGTCMVNRNRVLKEAAKVLVPGGHLVWLDQVLPMYRKDELHLWGLIGMVRSTNHRFRVVSIFEKVLP